MRLRIFPRQSSLHYFPWRVYLRFVLGQVIFLGLLFTFLAIGFHRYSHELLAGVADGATLVHDLDDYLLFGFLLAAVSSLLFSLWIGRRFFLPMGRLILKARTLHSRRQGRWSEGEARDEDVGGEEWQEIESVLDRIQNDLRRTSDRLSRGRQEINTLMGAISEAILAVDMSGQVVFFNEQFTKLFGGREFRHEHGRMPRLTEIFRMPDILESFERVMREGETLTLNASLPVLADSDIHDYRLSVSPLRQRDSQEVYGALGIFHDVTELKKAERIRIEFVGNASHELRTPLTSVKGYLMTLRHDFAQGQYQGADKFLEVISRNVDRLIALVADLLDLSSIEGHGQISRELVSTREVTEIVLRNLEKERAPREQQIRATYWVDDVLADANKLEQVLTNLVYNAIKYIPNGKTIEVIWERSPGGDGVLLHVQDNGPGIAKRHLPRLFERFYRVDEGRAREAGGTGLGLAIVKHICLRHGGWVKVESEVGSGTRFTCYFPASLNRVR